MYSAIFLLFVATWQSGFCQEAIAADTSVIGPIRIPYPRWPICVGNLTVSCGPIYESNCQSNKQTLKPCDVCICREGYFRDPATGNCVLPQDCSNPSEQCPPDAIMVHPCITKKCSPYRKLCTVVQCVPLCECPEGFFWSNCGCRSLKPDVPFNPVTLGPVISGPIFAEGGIAQAAKAERSHHHKKHHAKSHRKHHN